VLILLSARVGTHAREKLVMVQDIRGFRLVFTVIGVLYALMASSMLLSGVGVLRDFAIPENLVTAPLVEDLFLFFYQLMLFNGVLMVLFGWTVHGKRDQVLIASVFCCSSLWFVWHDLSTSDSRFGNHLYHGEKTLVLVYIGLAIAAAFGWLAMRGLRLPPLAAPSAPLSAGKQRGNSEESLRPRPQHTQQRRS
jgi:hypothetical protein